MTLRLLLTSPWSLERGVAGPGFGAKQVTLVATLFKNLNWEALGCDTHPPPLPVVLPLPLYTRTSSADP